MESTVIYNPCEVKDFNDSGNGGNCTRVMALEYAKRGWYVIPVHHVMSSGACSCGLAACKSIGKHPAISDWQNCCTRDEDTIRAWWGEDSQYSVGIVAGRSGLVVIDIDRKSGGLESLEELKKDLDLGSPLICKTGGGGFHYYYSSRGLKFGNRAKFLPGIDVRGEGGCVVAPPSRHSSGNAYEWENLGGEISPVPDELASRLLSKGSTSCSCKRTVDLVTGFNEGERNTGLFSQACKYRDKGLSGEETRQIITLAAEKCRPPLDKDEVNRLVDSAYSYSDKGSEPISFAELAAINFPPVEWVIEDLLPQGVTLLVGAPKSGKSWMVMEMSLMVASGGSVFGKFKATDKHPSVLHLALEDRRNQFQERVRKILGENGTHPSNAAMVTEWPVLPKGAIMLRKFLDKHPETKLVIVDCLRSIRGSKSKFGKDICDEDYAEIAQFRNIAGDHGASIIIVHHTRKMAGENPFEEISGTRGLTAAADQMMVLKRKSGKTADLSITGRNIPEGVIKLIFDEEKCVWRAGTDREYNSPERSMIEGCLRASHPRAMRPSAIAATLRMKAGNVRVILGRMVRDREILKISRGHYKAKG
jgi:hypothetical protein